MKSIRTVLFAAVLLAGSFLAYTGNANAEQRIVLDGNAQSITVDSDARIIGTGAAETLNIEPGVNVSFTAGDGDKVNLPHDLEHYEITSLGNHIWFSDADANKVVTLIVIGTSTVGFADKSTATLEMIFSQQESESQAFYFILDQTSDEIGGPLLDNINVDGIRFKVDSGEEIFLRHPDAQTADDHAGFVAALQDGIDELIADGKVPEDTTLTLSTTIFDTTFLDDGSISSDIPAIVLKTQTDAVFEPIGFAWWEDAIGDYNVYGRIAIATMYSGGEPPQVQFGRAVVGPTPLDHDLVELAQEMPPGDITNSIGMTFNYIEPGTFMMGSPEDEPGRDGDETQHEVTLTQGYYMQTTEVTQGQWKAVMGSNPSYFSDCGDDCPVESVSWHDAQDFINALNQQEGTTGYALPTEAQWEYAGRAGSTTAFANGQITETGSGYDPVLDSMGWYSYNSNSSTHPVAQKEPNAWGLYDMHGNVWEWVADWYGDYPSSAVTNPTGPSSGTLRVGRGGSWHAYARDCRSAFRYDGYPEIWSNGGFRLVLLPGH